MVSAFKGSKLPLIRIQSVQQTKADESICQKVQNFRLHKAHRHVAPLETKPRCPQFTSSNLSSNSKSNLSKKRIKLAQPSNCQRSKRMKLFTPAKHRSHKLSAVSFPQRMRAHETAHETREIVRCELAKAHEIVYHQPSQAACIHSYMQTLHANLVCPQSFTKRTPTMQISFVHKALPKEHHQHNALPAQSSRLSTKLYQKTTTRITLYQLNFTQSFSPHLLFPILQLRSLGLTFELKSLRGIFDRT